MRRVRRSETAAVTATASATIWVEVNAIAGTTFPLGTGGRQRRARFPCVLRRLVESSRSGVRGVHRRRELGKEQNCPDGNQRRQNRVLNQFLGSIVLDQSPDERLNPHPACNHRSSPLRIRIPPL